LPHAREIKSTRAQKAYFATASPFNSSWQT
jgi:hypothetical protein